MIRKTVECEREIDIICIPGCLYDKKPWTNRQQVMSRLAKKYRVLFIEEPKYPLFQLAKVILRIMPEQKPYDWFHRLFIPEKRGNNLYILSLIRFFPIKRRFLRKLNCFLNLINLKRIIKKYRFSGAILWIYTPDAVVYVDRLKERRVVYDCVDEYAAQPYYRKNFPEIELDELKLLKKADCVITSSPKLFEEKSKYNKSTFFVPNAGDYEDFSKAMREDIQVSKDISSILKPVIGFVGAIDRYKIDFQLVTYLAERNPNWSIVLIGPVGQAENQSDVRVFREKQNIYLLGQKDYKVLPNYIKAFDVCIIPYLNNEYTAGCFPLKFFEFMATGKPIVISGVPALEEYDGFVKIAHSKEEFSRLVEEVFKSDSKKDKQRRIEIAKKNTWDEKVKTITKIITMDLEG